MASDADAAGGNGRAQLPPEVLVQINDYLESRRRGLVIAGAASLVSIVTLIGGFLAYALSDLRDRGQLAAFQMVQSIREEVLEPMALKNEEAQDAYAEQRAKLLVLIATAERAIAELDGMVVRARPVIEEVNKAEGSYAFADTMIEVKSTIEEFTETVSELSSRVTAIEGDARFQPGESTPLSDLLVE